MVFHAGIDLFLRYLTLYHNESESVDGLETALNYNNLKPFLEDVKSKIEGTLGCLCIILPEFLIDNIQRKLLINCALSIGFTNVKLIGRNTAIYFHSVFHSNYIPQNEDTILIFDSDCCYIWHKQNHKTKFLLSVRSYNYSKEFFENSLKIKHVHSSVILYHGEDVINREPAKDLLTGCQVYKCFEKTNIKGPTFDFNNYLNHTCYKGAIIQARIMANDTLMMKYDANTTLSHNLCVITKMYNDISWFSARLSLFKTQKDEHQIKGIQRYSGAGQNLPFTKTTFITSSDNKNVLSVITNDSYVLQLTGLPVNRKFAVNLSVDENGIISLDAKFLRKIKQKICQRNKKYYIPNKFILDENEGKNSRDAMHVVAVDLGTTRCCAAVKRRNGIETVALDNVERMLPSYVAFDEPKAKCGQIVLNRLRNFAKSSVFDSKRIIGKKFEDILIDQSWPFEVIKDSNLKVDHLNNEQMLQFRLLENNDTFIKVETKDGKCLKYPEEISAALLQHIKKKVEEYEGGRRNQVMITVPSTFTDAQKDSTCAAAVLAGFEIVDFMPEPVAAAFAYLINEPEKSLNNFDFLVFDLGGGTLDVCIFICEKNQIQILCQNGNLSLGGRDFDNVLIDYFSQKLFNDYGIEDLGSKKYKLMLESQRIKETLSVDGEAFLDTEDLNPSTKAIIQMSRRYFEKLSVQLLEKVKMCIINTLEISKLNCNQINKILLVGGGSRMSMIKELLKSLFLNAEHYCTLHPDEAIAVGAAYYAYNKKLQLKKYSNMVSLKNRKRKINDENFLETKETHSKSWNRFLFAQTLVIFVVFIVFIISV